MTVGKVWTGTEWSGGATTSAGYSFLQEVEFFSSGSFAIGDYPEARAIKVMVLGAGGGGGGVDGNGDTGGGGGGGGYAERWITDLSSLPSSVTVTIGGGGGGANGNYTVSSNGGASYFGQGQAYEVSANGGAGGYRWASAYGSGGIGGTGISGTRLIRGLPGMDGPAAMGAGGGNFLYPSYHYVPGLTNRAGSPGENPGQGASGGQRSSAGNNAGSTGANGYCRIEVYA